MEENAPNRGDVVQLYADAIAECLRQKHIREWRLSEADVEKIEKRIATKKATEGPPKPSRFTAEDVMRLAEVFRILGEWDQEQKAGNKDKGDGREKPGL